MEKRCVFPLLLIWVVSPGAASATESCDKVARGVSSYLEKNVNGFLKSVFKMNYKKSLLGQKGWATVSPPSINVTAEPGRSKVDFVATLKPGKVSAGVEISYLVGSERVSDDVKFPAAEKKFRFAVGCPIDNCGALAAAKPYWTKVVNDVMDEITDSLNRSHGTLTIKGVALNFSWPRITVDMNKPDHVTVNSTGWQLNSIRYKRLVANVPFDYKIMPRSWDFRCPFKDEPKREEQKDPVQEDDAEEDCDATPGSVAPVFIKFEFNVKDSISAEGLAKIKTYRQSLCAASIKKPITIVGHTDCIGFKAGSKWNHETFSKARADLVKSEIEKLEGEGCLRRLTYGTKGVGKDEPFCTGSGCGCSCRPADSETTACKNDRRVEFKF